MPARIYTEHLSQKYFLLKKYLHWYIHRRTDEELIKQELIKQELIKQEFDRFIETTKGEIRGWSAKESGWVLERIIQFSF